jgi:hypothetical protein
MATGEKSLPELDDSPRTKVFRLIESYLRGDEVLRQTVPPDHWQTWDGSPDAKSWPADTQVPAICLNPTALADQWFSPDAMTEPLVVVVELLVDGTNADDIANLWWAVQRALFPPNPAAAEPSPTQAVQQALRDAGAFSGVIEFTQAAFVRPDNPNAPAAAGRLYGVGQIKIDVNLQLNT